MTRSLAIGTVLVLLTTLGAARARAQPVSGTAETQTQIMARHLFTVADDFVVDVYHNGIKVPDDKRTLLVEKFGATAERVDVEVKKGDWLVFNVVNNRFRWGGCSYFAVAGRGDSGIVFATELASGRWSCCDDPAQVHRFVIERDHLAHNLARAITNPWGDGDALMSQVADGWGGTPLWGRTRNTWIKYVAR